MKPAVPTHSYGRPQRSLRLSKIVRSRAVSILIYLLVIAGVVQAALGGAAAMGYNWQWYRVPQFIYEATDDGFQFGELIWGLWATLGLSSTAFVLATVVGLGITLLRLSNLVIGSWLALVFLELARNLPILIILYIFYYVLSPIFGLDRYTASILCLALYHAALISEIFRAGIQSVPKGQWESAMSIGMTPVQIYQFVIVPQSLKLIIPPLTGEFVHLIKNSSIVSVIAVAELTTVGRNIVSDTYMSFEIWFTVAAIYLVVTLLLSIFSGWLESRLGYANKIKPREKLK